MPEWTPKQRAAIQARNRSILVSAAAGSGKTTVLIERIMALLREGVGIEHMLVVTFTRAAASEMRERLQRVLTEEARSNKALKAQRDRLGTADISTLHQFCIKLIRRHFQAVGTDPMAGVGDEGLLKSLLDRALSEEMEALYEQPDEDGSRLIDQYTDVQIEDMVRKLYVFLRAQEDPWEWLDHHLEQADRVEFPRLPWFSELRAAALREAEEAVSLTGRCLQITCLPNGPARYESAAHADMEIAREVRDMLARAEVIPAEWTAGFIRLPSTKAPAEESEELRERFKALRQAAKDCLNTALSLLPRGDAQTQKAAEDIRYTLPALRALCALTKQTHERYGEYKSARQLWDYSDLEHLALACLKDPAVRAREQGHYKALFVDEYQDISRIQEAIIRRLHGEDSSLFMVGDVKQSIYRFRLAEPGLFLDKYARFDDAEGAAERVITLSENFRSRDNILLAVNHVFDHTLRGGSLEIGYGSEERLYPGTHSTLDPACELHLILPESTDSASEEDDDPPAALKSEDGEETETQSEEIPGASAREAALMARLMTNLRGSMIEEKGVSRKLSWRDMVVLLRSASGRAETIARVLRDQGIPVYSDADQQFFDLIEVSDVLTLLHVLDNPLDDERLMAALAAPPFEFEPDDFVRVRAQADKRLPFHQVFFSLQDSDPQVKEAIQTMAAWRVQCENRPLDSFLRWLLRETGIYARAGAKPQGELRRANLRLLCERAGPNPAPQTLHGFLSRVKEARRQNDTRAAATLGAGEDVVRIMTIHKSKGLEFPVVFLPDLSHRFRMGRQKGDLLLLDPVSGPALKLVDPDRRLTHDTLWGKAIQLKKDRQTRAEEARLLYVAMTRAKERLVLISAPRNIDSERKKWEMSVGSAGADRAANMLEWIGASLWPALQSGEDAMWQAPGGSRFHIHYHLSGQLKAQTAAAKGLPFPPLGSEAPGDEIIRMLSPLPAPSSHPLKMSVTGLTHRETLMEEETPVIKRLPLERLVRPLSGSAPKLPGLERGTAAHKALGSLPLEALRGHHGEALRQAVTEGLDALAGREILQPAEREAVDAGVLCAFYESPLGQRLLAAGTVEREWPFTLLCEQQLILQGVLDCCFLEEDGWVLIDYKTDRIAPDMIALRYRSQLRWYMRALRDITGQPVKEACLYALEHGTFIPITEDEPIRYEEQEVGQDAQRADGRHL